MKHNEKMENIKRVGRWRMLKPVAIIKVGNFYRYGGRELKYMRNGKNH